MIYFRWNVEDRPDGTNVNIGIGLKRMQTRGLKTKSRWNSLEQSLYEIKLFNVHIQELVIGAQLESRAGQVRWKTKNLSLIVVVYVRKCPFYRLLCPTLKSTWLRLISLDKFAGEARVSSRKGKVLFSLKFKVWKYYVVEISRCCLWCCFV